MKATLTSLIILICVKVMFNQCIIDQTHTLLDGPRAGDLESVLHNTHLLVGSTHTEKK